MTSYLNLLKVKWYHDMYHAFSNRRQYSEELGKLFLVNCLSVNCLSVNCSNEVVSVRNTPNVHNVGFKARTYLKWCYNPDIDTFWYNLHHTNQISVVSRFRTGSHWLNINAGR